MAALDTALACPRCGAPLEALTCEACRVEFPRIDGVPWLFAEPDAAVAEWKNRWQLALEQMTADLQRVQAALGADPGAATRRRLETLAAGYRAQAAHLEAVLGPLADGRGAPRETLLALRTRLPPAQGIFSYGTNVHRDWCWGAAECQAELDAVMAALDGEQPARVLVLGGGAGRLAYDLHRHTSADLTAALDLNPLLINVAARVSTGAIVKLVEFPLAPRSPDTVAIERCLRAPQPARPGLEFVLGDAMRAPFVAGTFDLVVTPWLLDVLEAPAAEAICQINALLAQDGVWINQGSVTFDAPDPAARLTLEELIALAEDCGFGGVTTNEARMPYMDCPDSRHGRIESVVTLRARRRESVAPAQRHRNLPAWLVEGRTPVPALPGFRHQAMTTRMHAFIMTLIDGRRSLADIARTLEEQRLMPRREAEAALRRFLIRMHDEAARDGRPPPM